MATILVIDDDYEILQTLAILLRKEGHFILTGENGTEGLQQLRQNPVDLVITDIIMPEREGLETIRDMKKLFPELKIIAMSGGGRIGPENYLKLAEQFGAMKTITKPFNKKEFLSTVQVVLQ